MAVPERRCRPTILTEALTALFGESVRGLSPATISRLKSVWQADYEAFCERDWRGHEMVYLWADGIYINAREADRRCVLVLIGCDAHGRSIFWRLTKASVGGGGGGGGGGGVNLRPGRRLPTGPSGPRVDQATQVGCRRWGNGVLGGFERGLPRDRAATVLGAQDRQCPGQIAQARAASGQVNAPRNLAGGYPTSR